MSSTAAETQAHLAARAAAVIPGGVNSGQRQVAGPRGPRRSPRRAARRSPTATGRVFTDYHAAFGPPLLGHNDPDVDAAVAAAGRSVDLMGVGVTQVEVELAERLVANVPSLEKVLLTATGSEATFHALRLARTATGTAPRAQVPGLLPRLARLGGDERHLACRARRHEGSALGRDPARGARRDDRLPVQRRGCGGARARRARRRRDHPRADPPQHRRGAAAARLPGAAARARDEARDRARLRRGDHGLPPRARRLPGDRRRHARPDDARQGDGERLARLRARRQGGADGPVLDHARAARRSSRARSTGIPPRAPRRSRRSRSSSASPSTSTSSGWASGRAPASRRSTTGSASPPSSPASARSSSATSSRGRSSATTTSSRTTSTSSSATAAS